MKKMIRKTTSPRQIRHARVRARVSGTAEQPRLSVFRGNRGMTAQLIDDVTGRTLCYADSKTVKAKAVEGKTAKVAISFLVGEALAEKAKAAGITKVTFDRGGYKFHGRVAAVAEGARANGLAF